MSAIEAIEDLRDEIDFKLDSYKNSSIKFFKTRRQLNALDEALLALEQVEAIRLWCNRDKVAQEKYKSIIEILKGNYKLEEVKQFIKERCGGGLKQNE